MKRICPALCALVLLLAACSGPPSPAPTATAAPSTVPEATPAVTPTPAPSPEPAPAWWEDLEFSDLPEVPGDTLSLNGASCTLLAAPDNRGASLFCGVAGTDSGYLLSRDGAFCFLPAPLEAPPETLPRLRYGDWDGDGAEELALLLYRSPQAADLHMLEWDGGWEDHPLTSEACNAALGAMLDCQYTSRTASVTCGPEAVVYTLGPEDTGPIAPHEDFSGLAFFRLEEPLAAVFGVGVEVSGEVRYFANLTVDVRYDGAGFPLENPRLMETGGV